MNDPTTERALYEALEQDNSVQARLKRTVETAAAMVTCPDCGTKMPAGTKTCPNCGYNMTNASDAEKAAALDTQQRKSLSKSDFVFPDKAPGPGSYPIPDRQHGANALARANGKPEYGQVKAAVCKRYSDLPECK